MSVGEYCNRVVVVAEKNTEIREVARLMRGHHVGDLIIIERRGEENIPVGIVTDRDLVIEVLAQELDPDALTVADIMSPDLCTAAEDDDLWTTLNRMRHEGIRRLPVVNTHGGLEGILTADDVLALFAEGLKDLVKLTQQEIYRETRNRP